MTITANMTVRVVRTVDASPHEPRDDDAADADANVAADHDTERE